MTSRSPLVICADVTKLPLHITLSRERVGNAAALKFAAFNEALQFGAQRQRGESKAFFRRAEVAGRHKQRKTKGY